MPVLQLFLFGTFYYCSAHAIILRQPLSRHWLKLPLEFHVEVFYSCCNGNSSCIFPVRVTTSNTSVKGSILFQNNVKKRLLNTSYLTFSFYLLMNVHILDKIFKRKSMKNVFLNTPFWGYWRLSKWFRCKRKSSLWHEDSTQAFGTFR